MDEDRAKKELEESIRRRGETPVGEEDHGDVYRGIEEVAERDQREKKAAEAAERQKKA